MKNDCLVCGNKKTEGRQTCKMCGMKYDGGVSYSGFSFCSTVCRDFFIDISKKSPEITNRRIVL